MSVPPPIPPTQLRRGDTVRVIARVGSRAMVDEHHHSDVIEARFTELGLRLTYGDHVDERDAFDSSPVTSRLADLHAAFSDPDVAGILTVIGGFNSNELLPYLDWRLIAGNPTVFCCYSPRCNAITARTGLVTYSDPHLSSFGMRDHFDYTLRWFIEALFSDRPVEMRTSTTWTDDLWFLDQNQRHVLPNDGWWPLRTGTASGPRSSLGPAGSERTRWHPCSSGSSPCPGP